jgi:adenylate cyclase
MRSFAFVDLCGFTAHMEAHGDAIAVQSLASLREATRAAAGEHGVRIGKWLGDGAMLVGTEHDPVVACALGLGARLQPGFRPPVRGGVSTGPVVLFEGDDYVGWAVNVAARLCAAGPWQILVADSEAAMTLDRRLGDGMHVRGLSRSIPVQRFDIGGRQDSSA